MNKSAKREGKTSEGKRREDRRKTEGLSHQTCLHSLIMFRSHPSNYSHAWDFKIVCLRVGEVMRYQRSNKEEFLMLSIRGQLRDESDSSHRKYQRYVQCRVESDQVIFSIFGEWVRWKGEREVLEVCPTPREKSEMR